MFKGFLERYKIIVRFDVEKKVFVMSDEVVKGGVSIRKNERVCGLLIFNYLESVDGVLC